MKEKITEGKWRNSFEQMKKKSWKKEEMFEMERRRNYLENENGKSVQKK